MILLYTPLIYYHYILLYTPLRGSKRIAIDPWRHFQWPLLGEKEFALQALGRRLDGRRACESVGGTAYGPMGTTCWEDVTGFHGWDGIQWDGMRRLMVGIWLGNVTVTIVTGSGFSWYSAVCCYDKFYALVHKTKRLDGLTRCWLYNEPFLELVKGRIVSGSPYTLNQGFLWFCPILSPIHPVTLVLPGCVWKYKNMAFE